MDEQLSKLINDAVDNGLSDADVNQLVTEYKAKHTAPTQIKTARPEDFTPKSFPGFVANAFNDVAGMGSALRHPLDTIVGMAKAKQATDAQMVDEATHPRPAAYGMPGDRLADAFKRIPGLAYQHPVNTALEAAPLVAPVAGKVAETAADVAPAAGRLAAKATPALLGGAYGYSKGGLLGALEGATTAVAGKSLLGSVLKRVLPGEEAAAAETAVKGVPEAPAAHPIAEKMAQGNAEPQARARIAMGMSNAGRAAANPNAGGALVGVAPTLEDALRADLESAMQHGVSSNQLPGVAAPSTATGELHDATMHSAPAVRRVVERDAAAESAAKRAPARQANLEDQAAKFRAAREHGVGGFTNLPGLSQSELERIAANIDRIRHAQEPPAPAPVSGSIRQQLEATLRQRAGM